MIGQPGMHPYSERAADLYETPSEATEALLRAEGWPPSRIWEPCAGRGAISRVLARAGHAVGATVIAAYEVAEEFFKNSRRLDEAQRAWLLARGISASAIETDLYCSSGPLRFASVVFGKRYFDFAVDGDASAVPAFIVIARDELGVTDDLVAFDGQGRLAPGLGRARLLGEQMIFTPRLGEPLRIFEDVWAWLRADRDGVVILDWRVAAGRLEDVPLCVDSVEFGQILRERLARPAPPIFVKIRKAA
jgi:hypothetical protein